ncbi:MAG: AzlD domain-containing protein [Ruminococcus sp.]|nr:AzlD domain-containing protein [Ruminococcus sp.]
MSVAAYIILMAGVTYVIRMIPFTFFRKKIESKYVRSFLKYIPYAVLSAMTIPEIFKSTGNVATSVVGTIVAAVLAFLDLPLIVVALSASLAAFLTGWIMTLL